MINRSIIKNAEMATNAWIKLDKKDRDKLKKYFHLRPTQSGITIVSTLSFLPMRGLNPNGANKISDALNFLKQKNNYRKITQVSTENAKMFLTDKDNEFYFKSRSGKSILEEDVQATMINYMGDDSNLKNKLRLRNKIKFVSSELIFQQGKQRVDIVGYDKKDIYFFELKKDRTSKMNQLTDYINYYNNHIDVLRELLSNYPINPVKRFNQIKGCMIMQYCEDKKTRTDYKKEAKNFGIKLLFYNSALSYQ